MLNDLKLMSLAKGLMRYSGERQKVVAENIARADIPGAKAKDVEPFPFARVLSRQAQTVLTPVATNSMHMAGTSLSASNTFKVATDNRTYEVAPDGNNIVIEEQMLHADEARRDHSAGVTIYRKFSNFFRLAVGSGGG